MLVVVLVVDMFVVVLVVSDADPDVGGGGSDYDRMFVGGLRSISLSIDEAAIQKLA